MSWGTPVVKKKPILTSQTQSFLDSILNEKPLSRRQQEEIHNSLSQGSTQWVESFQSGEVTQRRAASHAKTLVRAPKVGVPFRPLEFVPQATGIRTETQIKESNPYERDQFISRGPGRNRDHEKDHLANVFQFGRQNAAQLKQLAHKNPSSYDVHGGGASSSGRGGAAAAPEVSHEDAMRQQIREEIRERQGVMQELSDRGSASQQYEAQLRAEIASRLQELRRWG